MQKLTALAILAVATLATAACNESTSQDAADVRSSREAIAKDDAAIAKQKDALSRNRAQKAAAKARGDRVTQAKESLEIGTNKAIIEGKQTERKVDERILEEDQEDLRQ